MRIPPAEKPVQPTPDQENNRACAREEERAFFGRGVIDVLEPPKGVVFKIGTYNPRALQDASVKKLSRAFDTVGKNTMGSPLVLHVDRDSLEPDSYIKKDGDLSEWEDAPLLKFKPRLDGKPVIVDVLAGQHRMAACGDWKERLEKGRDKRQGQVENIEVKLKGMGSEEQLTALDALKESLLSESVQIKGAGRWCVVLYDSSEC